MTDRQLLDGIASGDRAALASLYERYSKPLHDFARRTVRDPEAAADVVQNVFIKIWGHLQAHPVPDHAKAWIYSIARNEAIDEVRRSARAAPTSSADDDNFVQLDVVPEQSPEDALRDKEMATLVWSAASALNVNAYSLLDMHLRQDLTLDEIGAALGTSPQNVYKNMSRMRESLEEAVADSLLGKDVGQCDDLDRVVGSFEGLDRLTPTVRRAISKHVRLCDVCTENRRRVTAPAALFGRLAPVPLAPDLARQMFGEVEQSIGSPAAGSPGGPSKGSLVVAGGVVAALVVFFLVSSGGSPAIVDPSDAASTTHEIGIPSITRQVSIGWSPVAGAIGYSTVWDREASTLPPTTTTLSGAADETTSPDLLDGDWYFHLRTGFPDNQWTSTLHLGPFRIVGQPTTTTSVPAIGTTTTETSAAVTTTTQPALAGMYPYVFEYTPAGECGYPAFTDDVTIILNDDGTATLSQAEHISTGTWTFGDGILMIELVLDTEFPETYTLTSTDGGATVSGQSTYEDGVGCITTYEVSTVG